MNLDRFTAYTIIFIFGLISGVIYTILSFNISSPVDNIVYIDSLVKVNDSIKIKIEEIDSVKNAKVIEVSSLDNDSTLKLFYKLVKE